jgi:hypothetical protein
VTIDFAFIDGARTFDYVLVDFFLIDKLLNPGGIVILNDFSYPSIRSVCRYVLSNLHYKCIGPHSRELRERAAWQRLVSRVGQNEIGPQGPFAPHSRTGVANACVARAPAGECAAAPHPRIKNYINRFAAKPARLFKLRRSAKIGGG